jgi:hypothetical protein
MNWKEEITIDFIPERFTSSCMYGNKELHIDTSNGDYIFIKDGQIVDMGCEPSESHNQEIVEIASEIE